MTGSDGGRGARGDREGRGGQGGLSRREALKRMGGGALGLGAGYALPSPVLASFLRRLEGGYEWAFLRPGEVETMTALADTVIPADGRSGSASDAGTVEYVDFVLSISDGREQVEWREGLRWLDLQAARRQDGGRPGEGQGAAADSIRPGKADAGSAGAADGAFADAPSEVREEILDQVAWPEDAPPELEERAEWFTRVRDLVGAGFFSSRMGVEDIGYVGNVMRPGWDGAPPEALEELGLSYEEWDRKYGGGS